MGNETKTYKELCEEYDNLSEKAVRYYHKEFDEVYKYINELTKDIQNIGDKGDLALPLTTDKNILNEALSKAGIIDKEIISDFYEYRKIKQKEREIELLGMTAEGSPILELIQKEPKQIQKDGWRFCSIRIISPDFLKDFLGVILERDLQQGKGLYNNTTLIKLRDNKLDDYLMIEPYEIKGNMLQFHNDLEKYDIISMIGEETETQLFEILYQIIFFIKSNTDKPITVQNKISEIIKCFDEYKGIGLIYQILILQGLFKWFENCDIEKNDKGYKEAENLGRFIKVFLGQKLIKFCHYFWSDKDKEYLQPLCDYLYSLELGRLVQDLIFGDRANKQEEPQQKTFKDKLQPLYKEIQDNNYKAIENAFKKAIDKEFIKEDGKGYYEITDINDKHCKLKAFTFMYMLCETYKLKSKRNNGINQELLKRMFPNNEKIIKSGIGNLKNHNDFESIEREIKKIFTM